jgi:hypothetical protein
MEMEHKKMADLLRHICKFNEINEFLNSIRE